MPAAREFNFDGLIGPTHNYAGLSYGNVASALHRHQAAYPKAAALQGLEKMKRLASLGIGQAVLPPLRRPCESFLRTLGMQGSLGELVSEAGEVDPVLLATCYSASNMWTANAATVSPSHDCSDGRVHLTVANLSSTLHRSIEHPATLRNLQQIFHDSERFHVHPALPSQPGLADEGAANHTRLVPLGFEDLSAGLELFVYGVDGLGRSAQGPKKFPARQTRLACEAVVRSHGLDPAHTVLIQQNPNAIDAGVFHNDVISVGNQNVLLCHQQSFVDQANVLDQIRDRFSEMFDCPLYVIEFSSEEISLDDAVASYLFNSQLVTRPDQGMTLVCPTECQSNPAAFACTRRLLREDNPIDDVVFMDLRQSMNNGGGPACLRLRVSLTDSEQTGMHQGVILTDPLYENLVAWVHRHYRETLSPQDLQDETLLGEVDAAFSELSDLLSMDCA